MFAILETEARYMNINMTCMDINDRNPSSAYVCSDGPTLGNNEITPLIHEETAPKKNVMLQKPS